MFFFFNDTATTEIYTLSLHDALPICFALLRGAHQHPVRPRHGRALEQVAAVLDVHGGGKLFRGRRLLQSAPDRKSTRLNSSHANISYAVFCLKKKKNMFTRIRSYIYT